MYQLYEQEGNMTFWLLKAAQPDTVCPVVTATESDRETPR